MVDTKSLIALSGPVADYSFLSTAADCLRRHQLTYEEGWVPRETAMPLIAGSAIHAGVDRLLTSGKGAVDQAVEEALKHYDGVVIPPASKFAYLTPGHIEVIVRNYADMQLGAVDLKPIRISVDDLRGEYLEYLDINAQEDGYLRIAETPLAVKWWDDTKTEHIVYAGKLDWPTTISGYDYIVDHKCTSQSLSQWWADRYAFSHQLRGYVAILQILTGRKFAGAFVNAIHMGPNATRPPSEWAKLKGEPFRLFGPYNYGDAMLAETRDWAKRWLRIIDEHRKLGGAWPQNDKSCGFCSFKEVCRANPKVRPMILAKDFVKRPITGVLASGADTDD